MRHKGAPESPDYTVLSIYWRNRICFPNKKKYGLEAPEGAQGCCPPHYHGRDFAYTMEEQMKKGCSKKEHFRKTLERYLLIKGLDIVVTLSDGKAIELYKNRSLEEDDIVMFDASNGTKRIPLSMVKSIDLYAA
jgi:hypothetical protein